MTTSETLKAHSAVDRFEASSPAFDWTAAGLALWLMGGLYLDGWAHNHGRVDDVFFTPWHAILYSGALAMMVFLALSMARGLARGRGWRAALPPGYLPALVGAGIFAVGGGLDLIWHELFGVEVNLETLLSPTHLLLALGGALMATGPLRAAWARPQEQHGWRALGPMVLAGTLLLSALTFFTSYAHPYSGVYAAPDAGQRPANTELYVMNTDGSGQTRLTMSGTGSSQWAAWSPDGKQIVYAGAPAGQRTHLFVLDAADAGPARPLTSGPASEWAPAWAPDGTRIAYSGDRDGAQKLFVVDALGGESRQLLSAGPAYQGGAAWAPSAGPNSGRIAFCGSASGLAGQWQLYVANADGSGLAQLTRTDGCGPSWSPDGRELAFHSCASNDCDIWTMDVAAVLAGSGQPRQVTRGPAFDQRPSFSPDGQRIVYASSQGDSTDIFIVPAAGGTPANLTNNSALDSWQAAYGPDGRRIVYSASGHDARPTWLTQALGLAGILLQSALLMGVVLTLARRFALPLGALTVLIGANSLLMAVFEDRYGLALAAVAAGVAADILYVWLRPRAAQRWRLVAFAFATPVLVYGAYFAALAAGAGIAWTLHLWLGAMVCTGVIGVLLALAGGAGEAGPYSLEGA